MRIYCLIKLAIYWVYLEKVEAITDFHKDLASSVQTLYEKALFNLLNKIFKKYKNKNLLLVVVHEFIANGKITENTPFENIHIHPASVMQVGLLGCILCME